MRSMGLAWLFGIAAMWASGCSKPCDNTAQCGSDEMCVAAICQALSCEATIFAVDPKSGACVPLSGCYLTSEQLGWTTCSADPCAGLDENGCVGDARCQPVYVDPTVDPPSKTSLFNGGGTSNVEPTTACGGPLVDEPAPPDGPFGAPGVNIASTPKHQANFEGGCFDRSARAFGGCRAAPQIDTRMLCETLNTDDCKARRDCSTSPMKDSGGDVFIGDPVPPDASGAKDNQPHFTGQCFSKYAQPATDCASASSTSCLLSPKCQPIGTRCFCPPGAPSCDCSDGQFMGCETNDRLRRCHSNSECGTDERCDNDESCIAPRTFADASGSIPDATPGSSSCLGACVPRGCTGMGERMCNEHSECDGGSYGTVCRPKPYCVGGGDVINADDSGGDSRGGGNQCGCDAEFTGCAVQKPVDDLNVDRSLLVRDPEIIDNAAFTLAAVLTKLAPAGRVDDFTTSLMQQVGASQTLGNGAKTLPRQGYSMFLPELAPGTTGITTRLSGLLHITSLVNRLDLAKAGDCGEARLTYALTRAYTDGNQRMTLIVELHVPDDGNGCKSVAQRWAELSLIDSSSERANRLITLYSELLTPATLGQIRTNEFLNRTGKEPWELREFHLDGSGMPALAPVAQTVDSRLATSSDLLAWVKQNSAALVANNAVIPTQYLAASSTEDGGRLKLGSTDPQVIAGETALNQQACAGCHLTETQSPFVHIGERLGKLVGGTYQPVGRAVIDTFLQKELVKRADNLKHTLTAVQTLAAPKAQTGLARVH